MNLRHLKTYLIKLILIPVYLCEYLVACFGLGVSWLDCLLKQAECKLTYMSLSIDSATDGKYDNLPVSSAEAVRARLTALSDEDVVAVREIVERSRLAEFIKQAHPDRHLYAVLEPNRGEGTSRIMTIIESVPEPYQPRVASIISDAIRVVKAKSYIE